MNEGFVAEKGSAGAENEGLFGISSWLNHKRLLDVQSGGLYLPGQIDQEGIPANLQGCRAEDANRVHIPRPASGGSQNARQLRPASKIDRGTV